MGRLVTGVREAEERLAGIGRALQTAYEEELREATDARDSATRFLARAEAMEEASRSLGREEVTARVAEVIQQLRASYDAAMSRLRELAGIEKTVRMRLTDADQPGSQPALMAPQSPPTIPPEPLTGTTRREERVMIEEREQPESRPEPKREEKAEAKREEKPAPKPEEPEEVEEDDPLLNNQRQLIARIEEVERIVRKWPKDLVLVTIQEHVALVRTLQGKFAAAGRRGEDLPPAIERLRVLANELQLSGITGFAPSVVADWNKIAQESRNRRLAFVEARRKNLTRPG